ncbi:MAG: hypothetical protein HGA25_02110 [Clostridiales bacterium]|nr:hypothetical protein [Clostridiales bacterium]
MLLIKYEGLSLVVAIILGILTMSTKGNRYGSVSKRCWTTHLATKTVLGIELFVLSICSAYDYGFIFLVGLLATMIVGVILMWNGVKGLIVLSDYDDDRKNVVADKEFTSNNEVSIPQ